MEKIAFSFMTFINIECNNFIGYIITFAFHNERSKMQAKRCGQLQYLGKVRLSFFFLGFKLKITTNALELHCKCTLRVLLKYTWSDNTSITWTSKLRFERKKTGNNSLSFARDRQSMYAWEKKSYLLTCNNLHHKCI
jgi:hypothetical protein